MKTKYRTLAGAAVAAAFMAGCASTPVAVAPVGPEPIPPAAFVPQGYLEVFSDTELHVLGQYTYYYPHTGYSIRESSGRVVEFVPNHVGNMDEMPTRVTLAGGKYNIVAESASYGRVTVTVLIEPGRTTVVHLDGNWKPSTGVDANKLVLLPDGEAVGWK